MTCNLLPIVLRRFLLKAMAAVLAIVLLAAPLPGLSANCRPVADGQPRAGKPASFTHGLLWKIEPPGKTPSYLFGTFHSSDPRITLLPCPVKRAFDGAASYTLEVIANGAGLVSMAEAMFFNDGTTLRGVVGESLYRDTQRVVGEQLGMPDTALERMKPWAVMLMLSGPRTGQGLFLDMALQLEATRQNKTTHGLETMQEQIAVFNGMQIEDQVVLLRDAVHQQHLAAQAIEALTRAYLARDLDALVALSEKYKPSDARVNDLLVQRLLTERNRLMVERMQPRLQEGNAFVAVGALHLPGDQGLLQRLARAGYRVSPVY